MKDVIIDINSRFNLEEEEEDQLQFTTDGFYLLEGDTACISYFETEVTGMEGTRTSLFVMPDQVVVDREGTVTSRMVFREGLQASFLYQTPYGETTLGMRTRRIDQQIGAEGGRVDIEYVVDLGHSMVSRNRFQISVREIPQ